MNFRLLVFAHDQIPTRTLAFPDLDPAEVREAFHIDLADHPDDLAVTEAQRAYFAFRGCQLDLERFAYRFVVEAPVAH